MTEAVIVAPAVLQEDIADFHKAHFSDVSTGHFAEHFLGPVEEDTYEEELEEDGLGYYPDGVKRTLTDEQIAIFRHSEIQAILRERRHAQEARDDGDDEPVDGAISEQGEIEDGELEEDEQETKGQTVKIPTPPPSQHQNQHQQSKKNNKKKSNNHRKREQQLQQNGGKSFYKQNIKPDLRKRTWDKVETGMDSLAYDDEPSAAAAASQPSQRRKISYADD